ncbi:autotransporter outer membrane beta-barrel domain-containing protein [Martelella sp. HB161492]|uniref:autotransporter outer membrane beta-barrel domain-containing protein n=1 Tax=Martelella sp. HB161492 TaxID=2720726 RepID=UPI0015913F9C|nr:autotransporter outer membrane beta-barrel domain-containing protein [Martelella sp. HB161492]
MSGIDRKLNRQQSKTTRSAIEYAAPSLRSGRSSRRRGLPGLLTSTALTSMLLAGIAASEARADDLTDYWWWGVGDANSDGIWTTDTDYTSGQAWLGEKPTSATTQADLFWKNQPGMVANFSVETSTLNGGSFSGVVTVYVSGAVTFDTINFDLGDLNYQSQPFVIKYYVSDDTSTKLVISPADAKTFSTIYYGNTQKVTAALGVPIYVPIIDGENGDGVKATDIAITGTSGIFYETKMPYTGTTSIAAGALLYLGEGTSNAGKFNGSVTGAIAIASGGTLTIKNYGETTLSTANQISDLVTGAGGGILMIQGGDAEREIVTLNSDSSGFTGTTTVASGAQLTGSGKIYGTVNFNRGSILSGTGGTTLTLGNSALNFNTGTSTDLPAVDINAKLDASYKAQPLFITKDLSLYGVDLDITFSSNADAGIYAIISYSGTLSNGSIISTLPSNVKGYVLTNQNLVRLVVLGESDLAGQYWDGDPVSTHEDNGVIDGGSGSWTSSAQNWTDSTGSTNTVWSNSLAIFEGKEGGTVTVVGTQSFAGLQFSATDNGTFYTLAAASSGTNELSLAPYSDVAGTIEVDSGVTATISVGIVNGTAVSTGNTASALTKTGSGTLIFNSKNSTYSGTTTVSEGILQLGDGSTAGALNASSTVSINNGATFTINPSATTQTFSNVLSGTGSFKVTGSSSTSYMVTLTSSSGSFTGATTVSGATLALQSAKLGGNVSVESSGSLSGSGTIGGNVTIDASSKIAGSTATAPLYITGTITLASNSTFDATLGSTPNASASAALIIVTGLATIADTTVIDLGSATLGDGTYYLMTFASGSSVNASALYANKKYTGSSTFSFYTNSTSLYLTVTSSGQDYYWNPDQGNSAATLGGTSTWYGTSYTTKKDWSDSDGSDQKYWVNDNTAIFAGTAGTVTVDSSTYGSITVAGMEFSTAGYVLTSANASSTIMLKKEGGNDVEISVVTGTATINTVLSGTDGFTKSGDGDLALGAANTVTGTVKISDGTLRLVKSSTTSGSLSGAISVGSGTFATYNTSGTTATGSAITLGSSNILSGAGQFNVETGLTALNSDSSGYTGKTNVEDNGILTGTGKLGGQITIEDGGTLYGEAGSQLTMTDSLTFKDNSILEVKLGSASSSSLIVTKTLALDTNETLTIDTSTQLADGEYKLIQYTSLTGDATGFDTSTYNKKYAVFSRTEARSDGIGSYIVLLTGAEYAGLYWDADGQGPSSPQGNGGTGTWTATSKTWTDKNGEQQTVDNSWYDGGYGYFSGNAGTVTVDFKDGEISAARLYFLQDYTLESADDKSTLNLNGAKSSDSKAYISVASDKTVTFDAQLDIKSNLVVTGGGTLTLDPQYAQNTGTFDLQITGSSTLKLAGTSANTPLPGSTNIQIDSGSTLQTAMSNRSTFEFSGILSGEGTMLLGGNNTTITISGSSNTFTGKTTFSGGNLTMKAGSKLLGDLTVTTNKGDISTMYLSDNVTAGNVTISGSAKLDFQKNASATARATFTSLSLESTEAVFRADSSTGDSALINVTDATFDNATIRVQFDGVPEAGGIFTFISSANVIDYKNDLSFQPQQFGNQLSLVWVKTDVEHEVQAQVVANTDYLATEAYSYKGNARRVASSLLSLDPTHELLFSFALTDSLEKERAAELISGDIYASTASAMVANSRYVRDVTGQHIRDISGGISTGQAISTVSNYAAQPTATSPAFDGFMEANSGIDLWATGYGAWSSFDGDSDAGIAGASNNVGGFIFGADAAAFGNLRLGALGAYGQSAFKADDHYSSGNSNDVTFGMYGGGNWGAIGANFGAAYTWHDITTSRTINLSYFDDDLEGDYSAGTFQVFGGLGYTFDFGSGLQLEPYADAAYVHYQSDDMGEAGGLLALNMLGSDMNTGYSTIGLRGGWDVNIGATQNKLSGAIGWRHAYGDIEPFANIGFVAGGDMQMIEGTPLAQDQAVLNLGWETQFSSTVSFGVNYTGLFGGGSDSQTVSGKLSIRF